LKRKMSPWIGLQWFSILTWIFSVPSKMYKKLL
jgi:hypothetical protein